MHTPVGYDGGMTPPRVDADEVLRRAHERQEQQNQALRTMVVARLATIEALEADAAAMKACEEAGLAAEQMEGDGLPPLPVAEKPARRQRAPRGSGGGAPRGRRARQGADVAPVAAAPAGNGPAPAHAGATHGGE